jgi:hypothetical protein
MPENREPFESGESFRVNNATSLGSWGWYSRNSLCAGSFVIVPRNTNVRPLKQPIMDEYVTASVQAVEAHHPETGWYGVLRITGVESERRARDLQQGLFRAAKRMGYAMRTNAPSVHASWPANAEDGTWMVEFCAVDKGCARAYVMAKYGADRSRWAYSPIKGDKNYG